MATAATETTSLIAFTLPSTPYSVQMARFYARAALNYHGLDEYNETAELVTSELTTNAITHAGGHAIGLEVMHLAGSGGNSIPIARVQAMHEGKRRARAQRGSSHAAE